MPLCSGMPLMGRNGRDPASGDRQTPPRPRPLLGTEWVGPGGLSPLPFPQRHPTSVWQAHLASLEARYRHALQLSPQPSLITTATI